MKVEYRKKFLKELSKIPSRIRRKIEIIVYNEVPSSKSIFKTGRIEKIKGYPSYYKIRYNDYRIGIKVENDTVIFERVLHRKDIYRYFPPN